MARNREVAKRPVAPATRPGASPYTFDNGNTNAPLGALEGDVE
jgi:hypothetical protein